MQTVRRCKINLSYEKFEYFADFLWKPCSKFHWFFDTSGIAISNLVELGENYVTQKKTLNRVESSLGFSIISPQIEIPDILTITSKLLEIDLRKTYYIFNDAKKIDP